MSEEGRLKINFVVRDWPQWRICIRLDGQVLLQKSNGETVVDIGNIETICKKLKALVEEV